MSFDFPFSLAFRRSFLTHESFPLTSQLPTRHLANLPLLHGYLFVPYILILMDRKTRRDSSTLLERAYLRSLSSRGSPAFAAAACCFLIKNDSSLSPEIASDSSKDTDMEMGERRGGGGSSSEDDASKKPEGVSVPCEA